MEQKSQVKQLDKPTLLQLSLNIFTGWNATMEIKKDGTLTMDNGETFSAKWHQKGDKIVIEGKNISGIATLSDDQKTLYFENKPLNDNSDNQNGFMIGENSLKFEFKKVE
ncbi:hypothetical protein [Streptococcus mitis]|uniref:hypothetical protein n=1 Tax=Streptococcus mitis TaxID=28037 RepID=UPI001EFDFE04|nr:hypothetical protein [Streptococcus mitis]